MLKKFAIFLIIPSLLFGLDWLMQNFTIVMLIIVGVTTTISISYLIGHIIEN